MLPSPGEQILICSDGLHGAIEGETIKDILSSDATLEDKCKHLVKAAREQGGPDNITVIILQTF
jgi:protein phosphatase